MQQSNNSLADADHFRSLMQAAKLSPKQVHSSDTSNRLQPASNALNDLDDRRIREIKPLVPPQILMEDLPLTVAAYDTISHGRQRSEDIINGKSDKLLVVVGPCSIHDPQSALEYAAKLKVYADSASDDLTIVMGVYFEKPRTTVGWKGLINDPFLDGSFRINKGITTILLVLCIDFI